MVHFVETDACLPQAGNSHVAYNHTVLCFVKHAHFIIFVCGIAQTAEIVFNSIDDSINNLKMLNLLGIWFLLFLFYSVQINGQNNSIVRPDHRMAYEEWRSRRFGLFIHWSPSSGRELEQSHSHARKSALNPHGSVPAEVYDAYYKEFNPVNYNPDKWLELAYRAGMRYAVFVAKHHDGFCLWDSKVNPYNMMATPYNKDVARMFAEACRRQGMALGWQFSPKDWKHPDYNTTRHDHYNNYYAALIDELTSNYGPVSILWFDGVEPVSPDKWKNTPTEIAQNVYKKQPGIMLGTHGGMTEDFISFEVMVGPFDRIKPWETCEQINPGGWVYNKPMQPFPFKKLLTNLVYTVCRDGNYLLDVGPMSDGRLYAPDVARLEDFAVWMNTNKEAIHGTRGGPYRDGEWGGATCREKCVYLFISDKIGEQFNIPLPDVKIINVQRLDGGNVSWNVANKELCLSFSGRNIGNRPDFICVKLDIDRPAFYLPLIDVQQNLALQASINVSGVRNKNDNLCGPQMLFDNKGETAWETEASDTTGYIEFDFGKPVPVGSLSIAEKGQTEGWNHRLYMALKVKSHLSDEWKLILEQNGVLGAPPVLVFNPVNTRFLKVEFKKTSTFPLQVAELRLFAPLGQ